MSDSSEEEKIEVPLLLKQGKSEKHKALLPYEHGADTYEQYRNPKNPFLERMLAGPRVHPEKVKAMLRKESTLKQYDLKAYSEFSPYQKRRVANPGGGAPTQPKFAQPDHLKPNRQKLPAMIQVFFDSTLNRLKQDPYQLPIVVNELVTLFLEQNVKVRVHPAFRQFSTWGELLQVLERIAQRPNSARFEFFCAAIFGFYSQLRSKT